MVLKLCDLFSLYPLVVEVDSLQLVSSTTKVQFLLNTPIFGQKVMGSRLKRGISFEKFQHFQRRQSHS
ncbi:hypothetical protein GIB67_036791 [Kingdonia uniflora]|uniref:Uncharacterized protein n=1 Tax=Kingdonia uniflora TaxID=39325 RepID=A0A7J7LWX2_9MAGN|nr:hypothetical protein GIB67_036791 [Kingdonia uniflora]